MASSRPSSAPLFRPESQYFPDIDMEAGEDPFVTNIGSGHQFLGNEASHHNGESTLGPRGNRVQAGQLPSTSGSPVGAPSAINPAGR